MRPSALLLLFFLLLGTLSLAWAESACTPPEEEGSSCSSSSPSSAEVIPSSESFAPSNPEPFIATDEFQEIKEGQAIPPGLHVRLNIQTGKREAKLLAREEEEQQQRLPEDLAKKEVEEEAKRAAAGGETGIVMVAEQPEVEEDEEQQQEQQQAVKPPRRRCPKARKNLKLEAKIKQEAASAAAAAALSPSPSPPESSSSSSSSSSNEEPSAFAEMTPERRKELEEVMEILSQAANAETDALKEHVATLKDGGASEELLLAALGGLDEIVRMYDYGRDFVTLGGVVPLVNLLSHPSPKIRGEGAIVLAAALQSNPGVQLYCYEDLNLLSLLIEATEREQDFAVKRRILHAFSCLARGFPQATKDVIFKGYLSKLSILFDHTQDEAFKRKAVTLVSDLLREGAERDMGEDFLAALNNINQIWCPKFLELLKSKELISIEKGLQALETSGDCLRHQDARHDLKKAKKTLSKVESDDLAEELLALLHKLEKQLKQ